MCPLILCIIGPIYKCISLSSVTRGSTRNASTPIPMAQPEQLMFMSVVASPAFGPTPKEKSFEVFLTSLPLYLLHLNHQPQELRVEDYLKAWIETRNPPAPCPQLPAGDRERAALGLPPLFKPHKVSSDGSHPAIHKAVANDSQPHQKITVLESVPTYQQFIPTSTKDDLSDRFQSISAQIAFQHFSHEVSYSPCLSSVYSFPCYSVPNSFANFTFRFAMLHPLEYFISKKSWHTHVAMTGTSAPGLFNGLYHERLQPKSI